MGFGTAYFVSWVLKDYPGSCNWITKIWLYPQFLTIRAKCNFKKTFKLATRRLCTNLLTINGIWDRIFCELGIDGLSWSACNGSTKIWRAHFDRPWEFYALNFLDENDDIFRLFPFVAYMNRGDVLEGGWERSGRAFHVFDALESKTRMREPP